jgi:hypothetical protein
MGLDGRSAMKIFCGKASRPFSAPKFLFVSGDGTILA